MAIEVSCTNCGRRLRAPDSALGKKGRCPHCKTPLIVNAESVGDDASSEVWYVRARDGSEQHGPLSFSVLERWAAEGRITSDCEIYCYGWGEWKAACDVFPCLPRTEPATKPPTPPIRQKSVSAKSNRAYHHSINPNQHLDVMARFRQDKADVLMFMVEFVRVCIRANPIHLSIAYLSGGLSQVTDATPHAEIAAIVGHALRESDLSNGTETYDELTQTVVQLVARSFSESRKPYDAALSADVDLQISADQWEYAARFHADRFAQIFSSHRDEIKLIQRHFCQIQKYYPRYRDIMTRTGVVEFIVGAAAAFFAGALGMFGAELWDNWRGADDNTFLQKFKAALDEFETSTMAFTQNLETQLEPSIQQYYEDVNDCLEEVIGRLPRLAERGHDLEIIYERVRETFGEDCDKPEQIHMFELVLERLRQTGISRRSEQNLRSLLRMT